MRRLRAPAGESALFPTATGVSPAGAFVTPLYAAATVLHALAAVIGFGSLLATGSYARAARLSGAERASGAVRRYFRPGRNAAGLALFAVPLLGVVLLGLGGWKDASRPFPWVGLACWLAAAGVATGSLWPSERAIQQLLATSGEEVRAGRANRPAGASAVDGAGEAALAEACRRCERAAAVTSVCFVIALFFMVVQPA